MTEKPMGLTVITCLQLDNVFHQNKALSIKYVSLRVTASLFESLAENNPNHLIYYKLSILLLQIQDVLFAIKINYQKFIQGI